jgi:phospholipase C
MAVQQGTVQYFPFSANQPLGSEWQVTPNANGPSIAAADGYLRYQATHQPGYNQWLMVSINQAFPTENGCVISYRVRANEIDCQEMKFTISPTQSVGIIFRSAKLYGGGPPQYVRASDGATLAVSAIRGDGNWHSITMIVTPLSVTLFEDGKQMFIYSVGVPNTITPRFDMQCLNVGDSLSFDLSNVTVKLAMGDPAPCVKHVFLLMLENRSFDHLLGRSNITGSDAATGDLVNIAGVYGSPPRLRQPPFWNSYNNEDYSFVTPGVDPMTTDPGHELLDTLEQLCGPGTQKPYMNGVPPVYPAINNSGFVASYATTTTEGATTPTGNHYGDVMALCDPSQVPVLVNLAKNYAVCDNWFSSVPGPTWPNRMFALGGSSSGLDQSPSMLFKAEIETQGFEFHNGSIFKRIEESGRQWHIYNDYDNQFTNVPKTHFGSVAISAYLKDVKGIFTSPNISLKSFPDDLKKPYPYSFTLIEPNYGDAEGDTFMGGSSQHPMDGLDAGERLLAYVYNSIRQSPLWKESLLIVTYDEHGGFFDHVAPPPAPEPGDGVYSTYNQYGFKFNQYGVRVPAVIISPMVKKNVIDRSLYDHTSILRTLQDIFYLQPFTARDLAARSLLHLLDPHVRSEDDCPWQIDASPIPPTKRVIRDPVAQAAKDEEFLPESGNMVGILLIVAKTDIELSGGTDSEKAAILARLATIKTKGDARRYVDDVMARVDAKRK